MTKSETNIPKLTGIQWAICTIAVIGFAFDTFEILMLPLILQPAILELTKCVAGTPEFAACGPGSPAYVSWARMMFYVPAFAAGIFGLLGGYLTDLFGRRRVLTFSILLYGVSAFLSGFATSMEMLLVLRCCVFIGVSVEFVAAVAWLAELFPHPVQREKVLGYTQACSSFGGVMVGFANLAVVQYAINLPAVSGFGLGITDPHAPWRYTLMTGLIPAIPLILIRPFLPESPVWKEKRAAGTLKRPSFGELFAPALRRTTLVTTIMVALSYGAAFGAIQQLPQIAPGVPDVVAEAQGKPPAEVRRVQQQNAALLTSTQEWGGLFGRVLLALLALRIVSRQKLIRLFQFPGLIAFPLTFALAATTSLNWLFIGAFVCGMLTVGQFSFWGNYLPRVYPLHLRGTGESFAANIGGRLIGTCFAYLTLTLAQTTDRAYAPIKLAYVAAGVGFAVYLIGLVSSYWLPEPLKEELPE
jgi:MFS family permease